MARFDVQAETKALRENLEYLKSLPVEEYTFRKKWDEMQNEIPAHRYHVHSAYHAMWGHHGLDYDDEEKTIEALLASQSPHSAMKPSGQSPTTCARRQPRA